MRRSREKQIIINVLNNFLSEHDNVSACVKKTAICVEYVKDGPFGIINKVGKVLWKPLVKEGKLTIWKDVRSSKYDHFYISAQDKQCMHCVKNKYIPPTVLAVMDYMNKIGELPNITRSTLLRLLHDIGFVYEKEGIRGLFFSHKDDIRWRDDYLRKVGKASSE